MITNVYRRWMRWDYRVGCLFVFWLRNIPSLWCRYFYLKIYWQKHDIGFLRMCVCVDCYSSTSFYNKLFLWWKYCIKKKENNNGPCAWGLNMGRWSLERDSYKVNSGKFTTFQTKVNNGMPLISSHRVLIFSPQMMTFLFGTM